jgi:hypothetical protein
MFDRMFDGYPRPPCPDCPPPGPLETFLGLWIILWMLFLLALWLLPARYGAPIWRVAFPFAPRVEVDEKVLSPNQKKKSSGSS